MLNVANKKLNNKKELFITSFLPCSYTACQNNPNNINNCKHKSIRNVQTYLLQCTRIDSQTKEMELLALFDDNGGNKSLEEIKDL